MAVNSRFVESLNEIVKILALQLKTYGFSKNGRTFTRLVDDRILFILNLQMGQYPIGDYVIPGFRESLYGKFAINMGVFVPQIYELENTTPLPKKVSEAHCQFRDRLKEDPSMDDQWFELNENTVQTVTKISHIYEQYGKPFFENFSSIKKIIEFYNIHGDFPLRNHYRAAFDVALLYFSIGNFKDYNEKIMEILNNSDHRGFKEHVEKIMARIANRNEVKEG